MTPPWLHFQVTTPAPVTMGAGALLDYRLRLHGVPMRWQTRIETWEPPTRFVDTQVKGPYSLWEHTHVFEPDGERRRVIHDRVRYAIPSGRSARSPTASSSAATSSGSSTSAATPSPPTSQ